MFNKVRRFAFVGAVVLTVPIAAQQTVNNASVSGRVIDVSGGTVEKAQVVATHLETRLATTAETDEEGRFRFPYLTVGSYEISARKSGFGEAKQAITLAVGAAYELPVTLSVETAVTQIVVHGDAVVLEAARSQIAGTVPQTEISKLPLNGRNFLDLALLLPGVSPTNTASAQLFPETSAVSGQGISINSQRNFSNSFIVDGLSANDDAAGLSGIPYGVDAVNQFQVVTSGGQAEFGRALGGYINVVTNSGTNSLRGALYGYFRDKRLNARNGLSGTKLPFTQVQYGASLGGPIVKERTFYFGNFEQRRLNQSGLVTIAPANVAIINARLSEVRYSGPPVTTGLYPNPVDTTNAIVKVDHQLNMRDLLTVRYSLYDVSSNNSRGVGALSAPSAAAGLANTDQNIAAGNILSLSPRVVNETRAQYIHSNLAAEPNDSIGPAVSIAGVATFGRLSGSPTGRANKLIQVVNNLSLQAHAHAMRVGGDFLYNDTTITYPRAVRGSYSFSSLANFLAGTYNNAGFTQTFGPSVVPQQNPNLGVYAQDEWKLHPRLTLNAGIRYDLQYLESIKTDTNNISPRFGLAWTPLKSRRTVIRSSYGIFYDRIPLRAVANAILSSGNSTVLSPSSQISVGLSPTQSGAPLFPNILTTTPSAVLVNFSTMDREIQSAYSVQTSVEVEQQLGSRNTISAGYQRVRGIHLLAAINQNVPSCVAAAANNGCRPNSGYANNSQYSSRGDSEYNGLHVSFVQRAGKWGNYRVSYTYSKSMNNVGEFFFSSPINNFDIWQDWSRSDDDQRHRFVTNGTLQTSMNSARNAWQMLSYGFRFSGTLQYYSKLPFNVTTGTATIQGTAARPTVNGAYISRNAGEGFDRLNLNMRLSRSFKLSEQLQMEWLGEMFNATNRANGVTLNGTFGPGAYPANPLPTFRQVTSIAEPRSSQLGLRFTF
jgi:hypothetical protein